MRGIIRSWAILLLITPALRAAPELVVESHLWGFSGRPVQEAFNPLTLEVSNASNTPYAGTIALVRRLGGRPSGVREIQAISLAPGGRRIVQFYPYIDHRFGSYEWRVSWKGGHHDLGLSRRLRLGPRATVELVDQQSTTEKPTGQLPIFPNHYFPSQVNATESLETVVLTHVPDWEPARAKAFWQWLNRGGTVHLVSPGDGRALTFRGDLAPLNDASRSAFGYGRVIRHAPQSNRGLPSNWNASRSERTFNGTDISGRLNVLRAFGASTRPDISWEFIYLASIGYLIVIGPAHYLFARNSRRDYRLVLLSLIGIVAAFSWLFTKIGRRGFGESDRWLSAAIARPVDDTGSYDVLQWSHAFLTKSDSYQFRHKSPHQLFEVDHQTDSVEGFAQNGASGLLEVDIPLYSSRNFLSQAVLQGPAIQPEILQWSPLESTLGVRLPGDLPIRQAWYRQDNEYHEMVERAGDRWSTSRTDYSWQHANHRVPLTINQAALEADLPNWLLHWHDHTREQSGDPGEHAELLLYADAPESFHPATPAFEKRRGHVIYVIPLSNLLAAYSETH